MRSKAPLPRTPSPLLRLAVLPLAALAACNSSDEDKVDFFALVTLPHSVSETGPLVQSGKWLVYLALEGKQTPAGTDLNGDGDLLDSVAVRVDVFEDVHTVLATAARAAVLVHETLLLVVREEEDGRDWNSDGDEQDLVLLYHAVGDATPTFYATLSSSVASALVAVGQRAFFTGGSAPAVNGETDLFMLEVSSAGTAPAAPVPVDTSISDGPADGISMSILAEHEGVLFLTMDETLDGDLNGDGDALDPAVLALLDADSPGAVVHGTGLAVSPTGRVSAGVSGADRIVAFLVDEEAQGENLNTTDLLGEGWQPGACESFDDIDTSDHVLHWLLFDNFQSGGAISNTGLVGTPGEFLYVHPAGFVGVGSREADEGAGGGCDLNQDGDQNDRIFRWVSASDPGAPVLPETSPQRLLALVETIPGTVGDSTGGVLVAGGLWVILVDEGADGRDHDGDPDVDNRLLGAKDPALPGQGWNFDHGSTNPGPVGATWMASDEQTSQWNLVAISEAVLGADRNGDGDSLDSIPTFPSVLTGNRLTFPGPAPAVAVSPQNAGMVTGGGVGFFRVSERDHGHTDFNKDGDTDDFIITRIGVGVASARVDMATLNDFDRPVAAFDEQDSPKFGVILFQESMQGAAGADVNGDGDTNDFVPRYFRIPD